MEKGRAHIVEVSNKSKQTAALRQTPELDIEVVSTAYEQRLRGMEVDATHRACMHKHQRVYNLLHSPENTDADVLTRQLQTPTA